MERLRKMPDARKNKNHPSDTDANMEQNSCYAPNGKKKTAMFDTPVCVYVHSFRHKLVDPDGISAKAAIDGLVHAGILSDDTTKQIKEVRYFQTKIGTKEQEKTEITITEV